MAKSGKLVDQFKLSRDARGNFKRALGWKKTKDGEYVTHTFYLGREHAAACLNVLQLEKVWGAVHKRWDVQRETVRALWDETTLEIGKAVGLGKSEVILTYPVPLPLSNRPEFDYFIAFKVWLVKLREQFPMIRIKAAPDSRTGLDLNDTAENRLGILEECESHEVNFAKKKLEDLHVLRTGTTTGPKIGDTLDVYNEHLKRKYTGPDGHVTDFGRLAQRRVANLKNHLADKINTPLSKITTAFIDEWVHQ